MIESVHIRDYALIRSLDMEFRSGFNVLTGETGAGKSIVVGALGLALGDRASTEVVRSGAEKAVVEAVFHIPRPSPTLLSLLETAEIALEEGTLILSRIVATDGRSRAQVNGRATTVAMLDAIGNELVDLHGQHEHQSLFHPECQLRLLDAYAGTEALAGEVSGLVAEMNRVKHDLEALMTGDQDKARRADFMRHELKEIDSAGLVPGEEEELRERLRIITHAETISSLATEAYARLYEDENGSAVDALDGARNALERLADIVASFQEYASQITEIRACVENMAGELRHYLGGVEYDPLELNTINERLNQLADLKRKYGTDIEEILKYRDKTAALLSDYDHQDERIDSLRKEQERLLTGAMEKARKLSDIRKTSAGTMDSEILKTLHALDMPNARFETVFEQIDLGHKGVDRVSFLLSANAGESPKPLRQVASGGEISRIMLAIKAVFAELDTIPTLIFDEIDAGIGGATARRVAEKMASLAEARQVLCITHLAQIAAPAGTHFVVQKKETQKETITTVFEISGDEREKEIARLLDGSVSDVSRRHAKALLREFK